ncbi:hypothetical protein ABK040_008052 [Willaertia magna]
MSKHYDPSLLNGTSELLQRSSSASTSLLLLFIFIILSILNTSVLCQTTATNPTIIITNNKFTLRATNSLIITPQILSAQVGNLTATSTVRSITYYVSDVLNSIFEYSTNNFVNIVTVSNFTQDAINKQQIRFISTGSFSPQCIITAVALIADGSGRVFTTTSQPSVSTFSFTAWTSSSTAPKPLVSYQKYGTYMLIQVTMWKRNFDPPAAVFSIGFSEAASCPIPINTIRDGFQLIEDGAYYAKYQVNRTVQDIINDPRVSKNSRGAVIDAILTVHTTYIFMQQGTTQTCTQLPFTDQYTLQVDLRPTQIEYVSKTNAEITLYPNQIFVDDNNRLQVKINLRLAGLDQAKLYNWAISGPKAFSVVYPIVVDVRSDANYFRLTFMSNPLTVGENYSGNYKLSFEAQNGALSQVYEIEFQLQYTIPDTDPVNTITFDTQADTFNGNDFTKSPVTEFRIGQLVYTRVKVVNVVSSTTGLPTNRRIAPYNMYLCCTLKIQGVPDNQCRYFDKTSMTYQAQIYTNGTINFNNTDVINKLKISNVLIGGSDDDKRSQYAFSIDIDSLRTGKNKRCFFVIETFLTTYSQNKRQTTNTIISDGSFSTTYKAFDFVEQLPTTSRSPVPKASSGKKPTPSSSKKVQIPSTPIPSKKNADNWSCSDSSAHQLFNKNFVWALLLCINVVILVILL